MFRRNRKKLPRVQGDIERVVSLIHLHKLRAVIDIGANTGQYASSLRAAGFDLPIVSIEPGAAAHAALKQAAADDPRWIIAPRMAISDRHGTVPLHVNARSDMNSLKAMNESATTVFPKARPESTESVPAEPLDAVLSALLSDIMDDENASIFIKIDTQGSESEIVRGAERSLSRIGAIQMELSMVPLYEGESSYLDLLNRMHGLGYDLHMIIPGFFSRALGRQIQFDGVFVRVGWV